MGAYPYLLLFCVHCDWLQGGEAVGSSILPHALRAVSYKPAIWHPAGQREAQVHPDVVI